MAGAATSTNKLRRPRQRRRRRLLWIAGSLLLLILGVFFHGPTATTKLVATTDVSMEQAETIHKNSSVSGDESFNKSLVVSDTGTATATPSLRVDTTNVQGIKNNTTTMTSNPPHQGRLPYCLWDSFYGRTGNRIFSLARIWHRAARKGHPLALSPAWSDWYLEHFDDPPMPQVGNFLKLYQCQEDDTKGCYETKCFKRFRGEQAYNMNTEARTVPELATTLLPKESIRRRAEAIVERLHQTASKVVTVHRRNFEGVCRRRAGAHRVAPMTCPTPDSLQMCDVDYTTVLDHKQTPPQNSTIWLFTDGQVPPLDDTFPNRFRLEDFEPHDNTTDTTTTTTATNTSTKSPLLLEMWIMALSDIHWGNPESTMDQTIYHWRQYQHMMPKNCFAPNPPKET